MIAALSVPQRANRGCPSATASRPIFALWEDDFTELDPCGTSFVDHHYTRAYVRHLIHAQEMLGLEILSIHNLAFYLWLVGEARKHILAGDFKTWKDEITPRLMQRM